MEHKISVVINTYNAERHLERVLDSVEGFDEVLICDMESTDSTLAIAQRRGCRVVTFPREHYTIVEPAREFAIHAAKGPWVLVVDADEVAENSAENSQVNFTIISISTSHKQRLPMVSIFHARIT